MRLLEKTNALSIWVLRGGEFMRLIDELAWHNELALLELVLLLLRAKVLSLTVKQVALRCTVLH